MFNICTILTFYIFWFFETYLFDLIRRVLDEMEVISWKSARLLFHKNCLVIGLEYPRISFHRNRNQRYNWRVKVKFNGNLTCNTKLKIEMKRNDLSLRDNYCYIKNTFWLTPKFNCDVSVRPQRTLINPDLWKWFQIISNEISSLPGN